jgi:hypothetical protein
VFWSSSGEYIFGSGDSDDTSQSTIYRWQAANLQNPQLFKIPTHRIEGMRAFVDDQLLFSTEDGFVGIANKNGAIVSSSTPTLMQFPQNSQAFQVSHDGMIVAFPTSQNETSSLVFDTRDPGIANPVNSSAKLASAKTLSKKIHITDWLNSSAPKLNGHTLDMQNKFELVRCYAIAPKEDKVVLGTDAALRAYDAKAGVLWKKVLASGLAWNVAITGNGKLVVATLSDGTIRWYRMSDGEEQLALFFHANQRDWVLWRPDGYYASSELGDNLIGWHVNRGMDKEPDFYRAVQFERQFYRPDLLRVQLVLSQH